MRRSSVKQNRTMLKHVPVMWLALLSFFKERKENSGVSSAPWFQKNKLIHVASQHLK